MKVFLLAVLLLQLFGFSVSTMTIATDESLTSTLDSSTETAHDEARSLWRKKHKMKKNKKTEKNKKNKKNKKSKKSKKKNNKKKYKTKMKFKPAPERFPMSVLYKGKDDGHKGRCSGTYEIIQYWGMPIIEADGTLVDMVKIAGVDPGLQWTFVDYVMDGKKNGHRVGFSVESRTRLNKDDIWHVEGTIIDLHGCNGCLAFDGPYSDYKQHGKYVINGGTEDFLGAKGYITETFHYDSRYAYRKIVIQ